MFKIITNHILKEQKLLKKCKAFSKLNDKKTGPCLECGCNWTKHIHIKMENEIVQRIVNFDDQEILSKQVSIREKLKFLNNVFLQIEKLVIQYKNELNVIQESAALLDFYLKTNSNTVFVLI